MCISSAAITTKQQWDYALSMSYEVGTYIDLSYLNRTTQAAEKPAPKRAMIERAREYSYDVGTQLGFKYVAGRFITVRRIPVAFAWYLFLL